MSRPPGDAPAVRCPAVHVPSVARAPSQALDPIVTFLASRDPARRTRRFTSGVACADGRLDLCKQGVGADGLDRVLAAAEGHPWLEHFLLGTNGLGDEGARVFARAIERGVAIRTLYAGCNGIRDVGSIAQAITRRAGVRALWLKRNPIDRASLRALLAALPGSGVRTLDLTNCGLGDDGCAEVAEALAGTDVRALYLGGNGLASAEALVRALGSATSPLEHLYLGASALGGGEAGRLLDALAGAPNLRTLDLASNGLVDEDLAGRGATLAVSGLTTLALGVSRAARPLDAPPNALTDASVPELAAALERSALGASLRHVDLRGTALTSRGARALVHARDAAGAQATLLFGASGSGAGIAKTVRRAGRGPDLPPDAPEDARFIRSVYRGAVVSGAHEEG